MSWYKTDEEGAKVAKEDDKKKQEQFAKTAYRFWLPPDKSTKVILLDTSGLI